MSVLVKAKYYYDKFHVDGEWNDTLAISWMGKRYTTEKLDFFKRFYSCFMNDKCINKVTKIYVETPGESIRGSILKYNREHPEDKIHLDSGVSQFNYISKKLKKYFDDEKMFEITLNSEKGIPKKYADQLNQFISSYGLRKEVQKEMMIKLPAYKKTRDISDEEFLQLLGLLRPYCRENIRKTQKEVSMKTEAVGYLNYIMIPDIELSDTEQRRKDLYLAMLGRGPGDFDTMLDEMNIETESNTEEADNDEVKEVMTYEDDKVLDNDIDYIEEEYLDIDDIDLDDEDIDLDIDDDDTDTKDIDTEQLIDKYSLVKDTSKKVETTIKNEEQPVKKEVENKPKSETNKKEQLRTTFIQF